MTVPRRLAAFTLLELLLVLGVVAVLVVVAVSGLSRLRIRTELQAAQQTLVSTLTLARSDTRRSAEARKVSWTNGGASVTVRRPDGALVREARLPERVTVRATFGAGGVAATSFAFLPPHGRKDINNFEYVLVHLTGTEARVRVMGVTGKVVRVAF